MVEEKIGGNKLTSDGEFERPGAEHPKFLWQRKLEELQGSAVIVRKYLASVYFFGINYPAPPKHKEALAALETIEKGLKELETLSKM